MKEKLTKIARGGDVRLNKLVDLRLAGRPAFGVFSSNLMPRTAAGLASSPLDFVIVDLEHSPFDPTRLEAYLLGMTDKRQILRKGNLQPDMVPLVRLPISGREQLLYVVKQVLDLGPFGLVIPQVESADEARWFVQASRYPQRRGATDFEPVGLRGVGYGWPARQWGMAGDEYARRADLWPLDPDGELVLWAMVETRRGLDQCEAIARTPGVHGIFIGPSDLAFSLGVPLGDPVVERAIRRIAAVCRKAGVAVGTLATADEVHRRLRQGFDFLALGSDTGLTADAAEALRRARAAIGTRRR